jgi:hypothetical protein
MNKTIPFEGVLQDGLRSSIFIQIYGYENCSGIVNRDCWRVASLALT